MNIQTQVSKSISNHPGFLIISANSDNEKDLFPVAGNVAILGVEIDVQEKHRTKSGAFHYQIREYVTGKLIDCHQLNRFDKDSDCHLLRLKIYTTEDVYEERTDQRDEETLVNIFAAYSLDESPGEMFYTRNPLVLDISKTTINQLIAGAR